MACGEPGKASPKKELANGRLGERRVARCGLILPKLPVRLEEISQSAVGFPFGGQSPRG